jgi:hypothetical protein
MGVKDVSELTANYIYDELEDEGNIISVQSCAVRELDKRTDEPTGYLSNRSQTSFKPSSTRITLDMITMGELHLCRAYARLSDAAQRRVPRPAGYQEFLSYRLNDEYSSDEDTEPPRYQRALPIPLPPIYNQTPNSTVTMPATALETIIRAIGRTYPAAPPTRPVVITRYARRPPPTSNNHPYNRNYSNYGGRAAYESRGRGRGGGHLPNRRARRANRTRDPRTIRNDITVAAASVPIIDLPVPGPSTDLDGLDFLNDFADVDLAGINATAEADLASISADAGDLDINEDIAMGNDTIAEGEIPI